MKDNIHDLINAKSLYGKTYYTAFLKKRKLVNEIIRLKLRNKANTDNIGYPPNQNQSLPHCPLNQ